MVRYFYEYIMCFFLLSNFFNVFSYYVLRIGNIRFVLIKFSVIIIKKGKIVSVIFYFV